MHFLVSGVLVQGSDLKVHFLTHQEQCFQAKLPNCEILELSRKDSRHMISLLAE